VDLQEVPWTVPGAVREARAINFATLGYILFLVVVVVAYWLLPRWAGRWWLLGASLAFYGSWNAIYIPGFIALIAFNFLAGQHLHGPRGRLVLGIAVGVDLALLGVFKYLDWVLGGSLSIVNFITGTTVEFGGMGIVLPLAISFVTFTLIAYLVDTYRGRPSERKPVDFALYVTYFPHLIAGPIMRPREFLPQIHHPRPFRLTYLELAAPLIVGGLLKKTVADTFHPIVTAAFEAPERYSSMGLVVAAITFTFQLYLDFSGYTDIALGSAWLLGFRLPRNFDWPHRATSMAEFWQRWHITLGRWLRDYLYFPLGGSRGGSARTYLNLMITMTLCGIWHGAGMTYVVWGALQGLALCVNRWWRLFPGSFPLPTLAAWGMTFAFVVFVRIFFISPDLDDSFRFISNIVNIHGGVNPPLWLVAAVIFGMAAQWPGWANLFRRLAPSDSPQRWLGYGVSLVVVVLLVPVVRPAFIYFQF
jgi:alginate O-acetyltransferase complex protein AlgI